MDKITFLATIPPIQSAIKWGGDNSMRVQLDLPSDEIANAVQLAKAMNKVLRVTVELAD